MAMGQSWSLLPTLGYLSPVRCPRAALVCLSTHTYPSAERP